MPGRFLAVALVLFPNNTALDRFPLLLRCPGIRGNNLSRKILPDSYFTASLVFFRFNVRKSAFAVDGCKLVLCDLLTHLIKPTFADSLECKDVFLDPIGLKPLHAVAL